MEKECRFYRQRSYFWLVYRLQKSAGFIISFLGNVTFQNVVVSVLINTEKLNNIPMGSLITLRTNQIINKDIYISKMNSFSNIDVKNDVNGIDVELEYSNTLSVNYVKISSSFVLTILCYFREIQSKLFLAQ